MAPRTNSRCSSCRRACASSCRPGVHSSPPSSARSATERSGGSPGPGCRSGRPARERRRPARWSDERRAAGRRSSSGSRRPMTPCAGLASEVVRAPSGGSAMVVKLLRSRRSRARGRERESRRATNSEHRAGGSRANAARAYCDLGRPREEQHVGHRGDRHAGPVHRGRLAPGDGRGDDRRDRRLDRRPGQPGRRRERGRRDRRRRRRAGRLRRLVGGAAGRAPRGAAARRRPAGRARALDRRDRHGRDRRRLRAGGCSTSAWPPRCSARLAPRPTGCWAR